MILGFSFKQRGKVQPFGFLLFLILFSSSCGPAGGFSGAELANVVNEAALLAGRQGQDYITLAQLVEAVQRTKYGVNGGRSMLVPTQGLQRRLTDWVIKRLSSNKQVKAQPVGH